MTHDERLATQIAFHLNAEGAGLAPFEAWLLLRGMKTLAIRVDRQCRSAARIAEFLHSSQAVERVYYPGLESHAGQDLHLSQASSGGALLSFTTGSVDASRSLAESTQLFGLTVSFGSVGSSIGVPSCMSHASVPEALRALTWTGAYTSFAEDRLGSLEVGKLADLLVLSDDLLRLSPEALKDVQVELTMVGGRIVHDAQRF